jgi:transposase
MGVLPVVNERLPGRQTAQRWRLIRPACESPVILLGVMVNRVMYILGTGCQWAALPKDLPPRSTVNDYLRR